MSTLLPSYLALGSLALFVLSWSLLKLIRGFFTPKSLRNLSGPPAKSFLTGSLNDILNKNAWKFHQDLADNYGAVIKIKGLLGATGLYVYDPLALHHIFVKDQDLYSESEDLIQITRTIFGDGIIQSTGERHRLQRKMLTPVFSIAHMRNMVNIFYEVSHRLHRAFREIGMGDGQEVDIPEWMSRLALELIGQSGLGCSFDTLTTDTQSHPFAIAAKKVMPLTATVSPIRQLFMPLVAKFEKYPRLGRFIVDLIPSKSIVELKSISDTMHETSVKIYESKKAAIEAGDDAVKDQVSQGKDIISILMRANMFASKEERLSEKELLGQVTGLTFAAVDTTSSALTRILYLLATHKEVQEKLREEIKDARKGCGGKDLGYDTLVGLPYLDAVCRETLRLYPPGPHVDRESLADAVLPLSSPIKGVDGNDIESVSVPKGTHIYISIRASNRIPGLWGADSLEWKPERWLNPLPDALINAHVPGIYSHLMTFLGGGRSCIGFKFSQLEMKAVLSHLLEDIEFSVGDKEIHWHMDYVVTPTTDPNGIYPTMPLKIRYVGGESD